MFLHFQKAAKKGLNSQHTVCCYRNHACSPSFKYSFPFDTNLSSVFIGLTYLFYYMKLFHLTSFVLKQCAGWAGESRRKSWVKNWGVFEATGLFEGLSSSPSDQLRSGSLSRTHSPPLSPPCSRSRRKRSLVTGVTVGRRRCWRCSGGRIWRTPLSSPALWYTGSGRTHPGSS